MNDPIVQMLTLFQELYSHPPMTSARLGAYRKALADLTPQECAVAYRTITGSPREFYPDTGTIREAARPGPTEGEIAALFDVIEGRVMFRRYGLKEIADEFGEAAMIAVKTTGFDQFKGVEGTDAVFARKRFSESYREERLTPRTAIGDLDDRVAALIGQTVKALGSGR